MNRKEKELIYNLIKKASGNSYGYTLPEFSHDPDFTDDLSQKDSIQNEENSSNLLKTDAEKSSSSYSETSSVSDKTHTPVTIEKINEKILKCRQCRLCENRKNAVPGIGVENPFVLVIGEGPGEQEDIQGLPFVGPAGQLLDKMLAAIKLSRKTNCYILNTVKCRPPKNRTPFDDETEACRSFLDAQIHVLKPKIILCAGKTSAKDILKTDSPIGSLRGKFYEYNGIPVLVTYHPSALLHDEKYKRPAWEDLKMFRTKLLEISPDYEKGFSAQ